ncbi:hypothetical protein CcI49_11820 [Frankia sp. CcI49]|nr:hypothetical protein CcI49_11820 [Frankia sp. CcI49]
MAAAALAAAGLASAKIDVSMSPVKWMEACPSGPETTLSSGVMDPSLPWLIALSIGITSGPRASPTITRSGNIRSAACTSSAAEIAPSPSVLASRTYTATTSGWACS